MLGDKMLTEAEDRHISQAAWVVIAVSLIFLMCLLAAAGCATKPDMGRDTAVDIVGVMNAIGGK